MSIFLVCLLAFGLLFGYYLYIFMRNYIDAQRSGFRVLALPIAVGALPWVIFSVPLRPVFARWLPTFIFERLKMGIYGWEFFAKNKVYEELKTQSFVLATASTCELWTADPEIAHALLSRHKDFRMSDIGITMMSVFGPNILISTDDSWTRQRKVIASSINERISAVVFRESCRQTYEMLEHLTQATEGTNETLEGIKTIAIHVLGAAGYGFSQPWKEEKQPPLPGYKLTYIEAVREVIDNLIFATIVPVWLLLLPFMPDFIRRIGTAVEEFPVHTRKTLEDERKRAAKATDKESHANLMSMMVKMTDESKNGTLTDKDKSSVYLTEEEIQGNLFVFTSAGFDTTANTMGYAVTLLAAYPEWQQWIIDEIDEILPQNTPLSELEYIDVWPKVTRILALLVRRPSYFPLKT